MLGLMGYVTLGLLLAIWLTSTCQFESG